MTSYDDLQEPVFGQDEFRKPKVLTGWDALLQTMLVVLFGRPGCFPSIPELGMNIQKYRYVHEKNIDCEGIKNELVNQCAIVSDAIDASEVQVTTGRSANGDLMLLFLVPLEKQNTDNMDIAIGVQMGNDGIRYNYQLISAA